MEHATPLVLHNSAGAPTGMGLFLSNMVHFELGPWQGQSVAATGDSWFTSTYIGDETLIRLVDSVRARMASKRDDVLFVEDFCLVDSG